MVKLVAKQVPGVGAVWGLRDETLSSGEHLGLRGVRGVPWSHLRREPVSLRGTQAVAKHPGQADPSAVVPILVPG